MAFSVSNSQVNGGKMLLKLQLANGSHIFTKGRNENGVHKFGRYSPSVSCGIDFRVQKSIFIGTHFSIGKSREGQTVKFQNQAKIPEESLNFLIGYRTMKGGLSLTYLKSLSNQENRGFFLNVLLDFCQTPKNNQGVTFVYEWTETDGTSKFSALHWQLHSPRKIAFNPSVTIGAFIRLKNKNFFTTGAALSLIFRRDVKNYYSYYSNLQPNPNGSIIQGHFPEIVYSTSSGNEIFSVNLSYVFSFFNRK